MRKATPRGALCASCPRTPRGRRTSACVESPGARTGRSHGRPPVWWQGGPLREGRGRTPEMHGHEKSDRPVVPASPPNKAAQAVAEAGEGSGLGKENAASATRPGHRAGLSVPSALDRVRRVAEQDKKVRFTALLHHVDVERLRAAYWALNPKAATGVDGITWEVYGHGLEENLRDLHARVHRG